MKHPTGSQPGSSLRSARRALLYESTCKFIPIWFQWKTRVKGGLPALNLARLARCDVEPRPKRGRKEECTPCTRPRAPCSEMVETSAGRANRREMTGSSAGEPASSYAREVALSLHDRSPGGGGSRAARGYGVGALTMRGASWHRLPAGCECGYRTKRGRGSREPSERSLREREGGGNRERGKSKTYLVFG